MTDFGTRLPAYPEAVNQVLEITLADDEWTAVPIPASPAVNSVAVAVKLRTGNDWKLSALSDGATYATIGGTLNLDIAKHAGDVLFYARSCSGADTLEVIITS